MGNPVVRLVEMDMPNGNGGIVKVREGSSVRFLSGVSTDWHCHDPETGISINFMYPDAPHIVHRIIMSSAEEVLFCFRLGPGWTIEIPAKYFQVVE